MKRRRLNQVLRSITLLTVTILLLTNKCASRMCFACGGQCFLPEMCNCMLSQCESDYCFAEISYNPYVPSGAPAYTLSKGCARRPAETQMRCDHRFDKHTVHCICNSNDYCNRQVAVPHIAADYPHWNVTCHECDRRSGKCGGTCRGEYCYSDAATGLQLCAYGTPLLDHTYRTRGVFANAERKTCTTSMQGTQWRHECVCNTDYCNEIQDYAVESGQVRPTVDTYTAAAQRSLTVKRRRRPKLYQCFSCQTHGSDQIIPSECTSSGTYCVGQYCTLRRSTDMMAGVGHGMRGQNGVRGSRIAGCLNSTSPDLVILGCSQRWERNTRERIDCVCIGNLCNIDLHTANESGRSDGRRVRGWIWVTVAMVVMMRVIGGRWMVWVR